MGLDTVKLRLVDYRIASGSLLEVQRPTYCPGTGEVKPDYPLWRNAAGDVVKGTKAFHNAEDFNVTLQPLKRGDECLGLGCYVQFSAPKLLVGDNYHPTSTAKEVRASFLKLEKRLGRMGIHTAIADAQLSRLDTTRNIVTAEPFPFYTPIFQMLRASRMSRQDYDGQGFLWRNGQQQICAYDKLREMECRKVDVDGYPPNTIRFEHRLLKGAKIRDSAGFSKVSELCEDFGSVPQKYRETMQKQLFRHSFAELERMCGQEVEEGLRYFRSRGDRYWFDNWAKAAAYNSVIQRAGLEVVKQAVERVAGNRMQKSRVMKRLEAIALDAAALQKFSPCKRTLAELYTEMRDKVLAA